jgi:hypothetical protein
VTQCNIKTFKPNPASLAAPSKVAEVDPHSQEVCLASSAAKLVGAEFALVLEAVPTVGAVVGLPLLSQSTAAAGAEWPLNLAAVVEAPPG